MSHNKLKKIILSFLIVGQISFVPFLAFAQIPGVTVPVTDTNNGNSIGGIAGNAANLAYQAALTPITVANQACATSESIYEKTDSVAQVGFSGLALIGGDSVLLAQLQAKITAYNGFITCREAVLKSLTALLSPNVYTSDLKQQQIAQVNSAINAYKVKLEQTQERYDNAKQGFWKTLVFNILIKTSKSVATTLVGKLVNNYKITNVKRYVDSVATLMYDNQFLRDNYPGAQNQLMARAMLENPIFRNQVPPGIFIAADAALGFDPKALDPNDPFFYTKMAQVGSGAANPYFQHSSYVGGVDQVRANSLAYAQGQITQGQGYKAPVNCAGSLAQQQAIDGQSKAASDKIANRQALVDNLTNYKNTVTNISAADAQKLNSDLTKAQADLKAAIDAWNNLPFAVSGKNSASNTSENGGNDVLGTTAITICEAISSPANLINKGIDSAFKAIDVNLGQYNNNNLPGFMNLISDVASQIGSSFVLGGPDAAKGALMINENKLVSGAVGVANEAIYAQATENLKKGISDFSGTSNPSVANGYTISWSIIPEVITAANFVTISGDGISATVADPKTGRISPNKLPLSGSYGITTTKGGTYIITVFDSNGRALTSATMTMSVTGVLGAFTNKPSLSIRGPAPHLNPRGQ